MAKNQPYRMPSASENNMFLFIHVLFVLKNVHANVAPNETVCESAWQAEM